MRHLSITRTFLAARRWRGVYGMLAICLTSAAVTSSVLESQPQPLPTFRSGVQLVTVPVIVTDKNNNPVTDLTRDDFVITADGRPQAIARFELVSIPANHAATGEPIAFSEIATFLPQGPLARTGLTSMTSS
jgi:hypothetical protein